MEIKVVPAHAGVIPFQQWMHSEASGGSRTRGGDPTKEAMSLNLKRWFPHTRG